MNVILLEKVHNLGSLGNTVAVKAGYGRNYLIPKGMAVPATPASTDCLKRPWYELTNSLLKMRGSGSRSAYARPLPSRFMP